MTRTMEAKSLAFNTPVIISNVFQYLPAFDLCRCARVNKLWNNISTTELSSRKKPVPFYHGYDDCEGKFSPYASSSMKKAGTFEEEFGRQIRNLEVKPAFCIAFATCTLWENFEKFFPSHPIFEPKRMKFDGHGLTPRQMHLETVINTALKKRLPPNCQVSLYVGTYIIGTDNKSGKLVYQEDPAISGYVFPKQPQQGIQFCRLSNYNCEEFRATASQKDFKSALVLMNYKTIEYYAMKLKEIRSDLSRSGIKFPVQMGSDVIPLFFGQNVKTACFKTPFYERRCIPTPFDEDNYQALQEAIAEHKNNQVLQKSLFEHKKIKVFQELENDDILRSGTIAFMFGKPWVNSFLEFCEEFNKKYPFIPIAGLYGISHKHKESEEDSDSKCLLVSFNY